MVMNYMKNRFEEDSSKETSTPPDWASDRNASLKAWLYVESAKKEKYLYIKRHRKLSDYKTKKTFQIKGSEVAKALQISRASLMNTSKYSNQFRAYLNSVNYDLASAKDLRLKKSRSKSSRGTIKDSKKDLVLINRQLKSRVAELEKLKTEEIVRASLDKLPLPVKQKLGIS